MQPCHRVFQHLSEMTSHPDVKVLTYNHEGIFNQTPTDTEALKTFIQEHGNINYPVFVDDNRVAIDGKDFLHSLAYVYLTILLLTAIFRPGQNLSIPLGTLCGANTLRNLADNVHQLYSLHHHTQRWRRPLDWQRGR